MMSGRPPRGLPPLPGQGDLDLMNVDFLLPTGMLITLTCHKMTSLAEIKTAVWQEARNQPLFDLMKDQGFYSFLGVTVDGNKEEFVNESHTLDGLQLFTPLLKLVERQGDLKEKKLNAEIGALIGRKLADFDVMEAEVQDCRRHWLHVCEESVNDRQKSQDSLRKYNFSALAVAADESNVSRQVMIDPIVYFLDARSQFTSLALQFTYEKTALDLVNFTFSQPEVRKLYKRRKPTDFCLKILGKEEYLLDTVPLQQYKYVLDCLARHIQPAFCLIPFDGLMAIQPDRFIRPVHAHQAGTAPKWQNDWDPFLLSRGTLGRDRSSYVGTWHVKMTYKLKVITAKNCNVQDTMKIFVRAGLCHGDQILCQTAATIRGAQPDRPEWNEVLEFDVPIADLPRSAKLCFVIYQQRQQGRKSKEDSPLAWVNFNVFDYAGVLQTGRFQLYAWPIEDEHDLPDQVNYIGSTVLNSNHAECIHLSIEIPHFIGQGGVPIMFPSPDEVKSFAHEMAQGATSVGCFSKDEVFTLHAIVIQDPLAELTEEDKESIWKMRKVCQNQHPEALAKVLQSIVWSNRSDVAQVYLLIKDWPRLSPERAMELLHFQYADIIVRQWAVSCLECLSDNKLLMYLLQLVQALKFEPYLDCPLGEFLLRRGLQNRIIGHYLFWHLRAEMHLPIVSVRYGLMLEAYCRGCGQYRSSLASQVEAMNKWIQLTTELQKQKKAKVEEFKDYLKSPHLLKAMEDLRSPLNPSLLFKELKAEKCKVMDSKMRPLWLNFENLDPLGKPILQIFKNGDDLRQDMLTLQVMSIMDNLWRENGLDLRMNPYACLSMGDQVGLIEVVLNSDTIAKIQKKQSGARGAFDKKLLYSWLKSNNKTPEELARALENFKLSCAGSCVATYVLGIGDRHSDNILLKQNGQLVHIDFGHFLGNFKSKFGVKRERVPFVLTDDFIHIITREEGKNSPKFEEFKKLCREAFMLLRKKGDLFITLFTMMLSTRIPELRSVDDIRYISNALCLSKSDNDALADFNKKFTEAIKHSWSVSVNWYFHNVVHAGN